MKLTPEMKETMLGVLWCELGTRDSAKAVELIEAVLAALPKPEPVAYYNKKQYGNNHLRTYEAAKMLPLGKYELYTSPPATSELEEDLEEFQSIITAIGEAATGYDFSGGLAEYVGKTFKHCAELEAQNAALQERYDTARALHITQQNELEVEIDALLVAIEAKDAFLRKRQPIGHIEPELWKQHNDALSISPSAELLEARDRRRDAALLRAVAKWDRNSDDSEALLNEIANSRESGEWRPELGD